MEMIEPEVIPGETINHKAAVSEDGNGHTMDADCWCKPDRYKWEDGQEYKYDWNAEGWILVASDGEA